MNLLMKRIAFLLALVPVLLGGLNSCKNAPVYPDGIDPDAQQLYIGEDIAVVPTQYGKIRGYIMRNVYTFLGIPYGAPASGENRFMGPQPPKPWDNVLPPH